VSEFGDGSLKQNVLDGIRMMIPDGTPPEKLITAVAEVLAYLCKEHTGDWD
jgi:hypothetical protein